ncbi:enoyl-CoA hydratase/isomerase family protein [Nocardioides sp. AE5]|uniref:enoyl-CoA hydratase/isomerase family protein n=1 Tax=Nocardioides sp. AE5 TaxID=2962573 RepID=UPI00288263EB|nr:enoyl-CoA hydratase/isomerase family protein [Nocardioides sp. AE5]MDT0202709.1 enoyl-CoA hydratase/isomerase family protein [Nocardioides sp. AE5]
MESTTLAAVASGAAAADVDRSTGDPPPLLVVRLDDVAPDAALAADLAAALAHPSAPVLGISDRPVPEGCAPILEALTCTLAPAGPGRAWFSPAPGDLDRIDTTVRRAPRATLVLEGLLRLTAHVDVDNGLFAESSAYSMLLAGPEFLEWIEARSPRERRATVDPVIVEREGHSLRITLNRPDRHNAFSASVRDHLVAGLEIARHDPTVHEVVLQGRGPSFCAGGDLDEFGTAKDVVMAHLIRTTQSAGRMVHELRQRVRADLHGACMGAGIEIPAFAGTVRAAPDTRFRLPELGMGLIPGAGGTISIPARIGRWRTAAMALTGRDFPVAEVRTWGLVDEFC